MKASQGPHAVKNMAQQYARSVWNCASWVVLPPAAIMGWFVGPAVRGSCWAAGWADDPFGLIHVHNRAEQATVASTVAWNLTYGLGAVQCLALNDRHVVQLMQL